jgi:hypothetical protein
MAGMSLAGARSFEDFQRRKDLRDELLAIEIANETENERRVKDYRNPYIPKAVPPQYKSIAEQRKDVMRLERDALKILLDIGVDYEEAVKAVSWIRQDTDRLTKFVAYSGSMKREILKRANPMFIESKFLIDIIRPVLANADLGLGFSSNGTQYNSIAKLYDDYDIQAILNEIKEKLDEIGNPANGDTRFRAKASHLITMIANLNKIYPDDEQFNAIRSYELPVQVGLADELNSLNRKYQIPSVNNLKEILQKLTKYEQDEDDDEMVNYFTVLERRFTFDKGLVNDMTKLKASIEQGLSKSDAVRREKFDTNAINAITNPEDTANEQADAMRINAGLPPLGDEEQLEATILEKALTEKISRKVGIVFGFAQREGVTDIDELLYKGETLGYVLSAGEIEQLQRLVATLKPATVPTAPIPLAKPAKPAKAPRKAKNAPLPPLPPDIETLVRDILTEFNLSEIRLAYMLCEKQISGEDFSIQEKADIQSDASITFEDFKGEEIPSVIVLIRKAEDALGMGMREICTAIKGYLVEYIEQMNAVPKGTITRIGGVRLSTKNVVRNLDEGRDHFRKFVDELNEREIDEQKYLLKNLIGVARSEMPKKNFPTVREVNNFFDDYDGDGKRQLLEILSTYYELKVGIAESDGVEYESKNFGVKKMDKTQIAEPLQYGLGVVKPPKVGKGVEAPKREPYKTFGKYLIHIPSLEDNVANFKYPSRATIPHIKRKQISNDYTEFLKELMQTSKMNEKEYNRLCDEEREHFSTVTKGAGLSEMLKVKAPKKNTDDLARYELLIGEFKAGNNSPVMLKELRALIIKFMDEGKIKRKDGQSLLVDLSV